MKTALLAFLVSFSAMASECYVRTTDLVTTEVSLSREICINKIELSFAGYGNNQALIRYTLDGAAKDKRFNLSMPVELRNGKVLYFIYDLESDYEGGMCGDTVEATINARLVMNKDGSDAKLEEVKGSVSTTNDNCHSDFQEIQSFDYNLI